ncbi:MAG: hypothetical protein ACOCYN_00850 [Planctomycetota bacterium]
MPSLLYLLLLVPLAWTIYVWKRRQLLARRIRRQCCPVCGENLGEALYAHRGTVAPTDLEQCDCFQRRFARLVLECHGCGAVLICTAEGEVMRGYFRD